MNAKRFAQPQKAVRKLAFGAGSVEPNATRATPASGGAPGASGDVEPPEPSHRRSLRGYAAKETGRARRSAKPVGAGEFASMPEDDRAAGFEPLLTAESVATILNISLRQTRRLIADGALPVVRIGRAVRVRPDDLRKLIQAERQ